MGGGHPQEGWGELFRDGHGTGGPDQVTRGSGGGEVEEGLGLSTELRTVLGHQDKGTLNFIAAVQTALTVSFRADREA